MFDRDNSLVDYIVPVLVVLATIVVAGVFIVGAISVFSGPTMEEVSVCTQTSETTQVCRDELREVPE